MCIGDRERPSGCHRRFVTPNNGRTERLGHRLCLFADPIRRVAVAGKGHAVERHTPAVKIDEIVRRHDHMLGDQRGKNLCI